jgi:ribonuclease HI
VVLTERETEDLDIKIRKLVKNKMKLALSTENSIIHDTDILGVKSIRDLQREHLAKHTLYCLNHQGELGQIIRIQLAKIKEATWFSGCVVESIGEISVNVEMWLFKALKKLKEDNFTLCEHDENTKEIHETKGGFAKINDFISEKSFNKSKDSIRSVNIMFISQIIGENNKLKTWKKITKEAGRSSKGKKPMWFIELEKKLIKDIKTRAVWKLYEIPKETRNRIDNKYIDYRGWDRMYEEFEDNEIEELIEWDDRMIDINKVVEGEDAKKIIIEKYYRKKYNQKETEDIIIYSDGAMKNNIGGVGWVEIDSRGNIKDKVSMRVKNKNMRIETIELLAIILIILTIPKSKKVEIMTDSEIVVKNWEKYISKGDKVWESRVVWNQNNIYTWAWIKEFIEKTDVKVKLVKVKAHSNNVWNDMADRYAKMATNSVSENNIGMRNVSGKIKYKLHWKRKLINKAPREFIKIIGYLHNKAKWLSYKSNNLLRKSVHNEKIDWTATYKAMTKEIKQENKEENMEKVSYKIKNMLGILPTYNVLKKREQEVYENNYCPRCKRAKENWNHVWICVDNKKSIFQIMEEEISKIERKVKELERFKNEHNWKNIIMKIVKEDSENCAYGIKAHDIIRGLVIKDLYLGKEDKQYKQLIVNLVENIGERMKKEIWNERCKKIVELEKEKGMREKRNKDSRDKGKGKENNVLGNIYNIRREIEAEKFIEKALDRWVTQIIENDTSHKEVWHKIEIGDLWRFDKFIEYRRSKYIDRIL